MDLNRIVNIILKYIEVSDDIWTTPLRAVEAPATGFKGKPPQ